MWKDKDLERFFFLPQEGLEHFKKQLAADVDFLEAHNMMDYSFLIGVRERPADYFPDASTKAPSYFRSYMGGTPGHPDCGEVYYIGTHPPLLPFRGDALEWKGTGRCRRLSRRLEEVAKEVGGGYCRLQMPLRLAFGVRRETVAGHRLGALEGGLGGTFQHAKGRTG